MNVPGRIDRLTFGSAGNESENQVNSFFAFLFSQRGSSQFVQNEEEG